MNPATFEWSAFDPNRWDHYYAAGQQVRFYRQAPCHLSGSGFFIPEATWVTRIFRFLAAVTPFRSAQ